MAWGGAAALAGGASVVIAGLAWWLGHDFGYSSTDLIPRWLWIAAGLTLTGWLIYRVGLVRNPIEHTPAAIAKTNLGDVGGPTRPA
jgi:hypothetical protein